MPFDASYQAPQVPGGYVSMQDAQAKDLTLRNAVQQSGLQRQMGQQQVQEGALDLKQKQIDMQDAQTMREAYMQSGGDMAKTQQIMMQRGASPKAITQIQQQVLAMQETHAKLDDQQLKNEAAKAQAVGATAQGLLAMPDEASRAIAWPAARQQMLTQGHASAAEIPAEYPGQDFLTLHRNAAVTAQDSIKNAYEQKNSESAATTAAARQQAAQTAAEKQANEAPGQVADALQKQIVTTAPALEAAFASGGLPAVQAQLDALPYGVAKRFINAKKPGDFTAAALTPDQTTQATQAAANAKEVATRDAATAHYQQGELGVLNARLGVEREAQGLRVATADPFGALGINKHPLGAGASASGTEFLGTLPPPMATRVQAISDGRETLSAREKGTPAGQALMSAVEQYSPGWSEQRGQIRKAFTQGPDGRNIGNLNTAPVHLSALADAATAMQNGQFVPGNQLYNTVSTMFGGTAPTNFNAMKSVVAGEMASAMKGNATDPEIASFNKSVSDAASPAQLAGVIQKVFIPALGAKLNTYNERYQAISPGDSWSPVLPSARAVFNRYGVNPTPTAPAGATPAKPSGAAPSYKVGDTVMYKGAPHTVTGIHNGKLVLEGN